ncbi:MAG TPA: retropepsin-like aspartic protease [Phenylobacterium sp.]|nr:retropepsin-like aspartic protease [Phenylobacterium sp.]
MSFWIAALPVNAAERTCLPYQAGDGGNPVIALSVNGRPSVWLVLDTAASGTTLDKAAISEMGLGLIAPADTGEGMGGSMAVRLFEAEEVKAGPVVHRNFTIVEVPAPAFDSHPVVGIAGVDLFGPALTVWDGSGCVHILPGGGRPDGPGWRRLDARWLQAWKVLLPISIDGVAGWGLLDTGAQSTVLNTTFAKRLGLTDKPDQLKPRGSIAGLDGRELPLSSADVADLHIGPWRWARQNVGVADLPVFQRLGSADEFLAVIGADLLADKAFALDYASKVLWARPQATRP